MVRKKRGHRTARRSRFKSSNSKSKINLVVNQLLFFVALCLVSLVFYMLVKNAILLNLFSAMAGIFGFIAVGFLIALLVLLIRKAMKK
jgi:hypothetical protein